MPAVTAKMDGDAVRTGLFTDNGGGNDARLDGLAGLADSGDVVDIDVKFGSDKGSLPQRRRDAERIMAGIRYFSVPA